MEIAYQPRILKNLTEICAEMGVGVETVKKWIDQGAPIAVEYQGAKPRYSAEACELQAWRKKQGVSHG